MGYFPTNGGNCCRGVGVSTSDFRDQKQDQARDGSAWVHTFGETTPRSDGARGLRDIGERFTGLPDEADGTGKFQTNQINSAADKAPSPPLRHSKIHLFVPWKNCQCGGWGWGAIFYNTSNAQLSKHANSLPQIGQMLHNHHTPCYLACCSLSSAFSPSADFLALTFLTAHLRKREIPIPTAVESNTSISQFPLEVIALELESCAAGEHSCRNSGERH